jgi:beta-mannosidase
MYINLAAGWQILQDVHDLGETCAIYRETYNHVSTSSQFSEWESIAYLSHLQPYLSERPYYGRELRYFNHSPWWYRNVFELPEDPDWKSASIRFEGVDYYCKIWINGEYAGEHEGYGTPFEVPAYDLLKAGSNILMVKVWSPWDNEVLAGKEDQRVFHVVRNMMKGTYEHDDTLIQRDVNPVGIYGEVKVILGDAARIVGAPKVYNAGTDGRMLGGVMIDSDRERSAMLRVSIYEHSSGVKVAGGEQTVLLAVGQSELRFEQSVDDFRIWQIWDKGEPFLYRVQTEVVLDGDVADSASVSFGFRDIALLRNAERTEFYLNGRRLFLRGTCYLPDIYLSEMSPERYRRDMELVKQLGFNSIRVHVHIAKRCLYEICDELGIAVIQDSDFNWTHADDEGFARRSVKIMEEMIDHLRSHPSIIAWICMNEPDFIKDRRQVDGNPGPQLWDATNAADPWRPAIKASYLDDDPHSGDSHNYLGSLEDETSLYTDTDGRVEKLNTEFGIDAPPIVANLRRDKKVWDRLKAIESDVDSIQYYQYRLVKYFIEHYRIMKYEPCSGYYQFMLNDLCPQSYYGIYDWWGIPKKCADACYESNMPLAVIMKKRAQQWEIMLVNDSNACDNLTVSWSIVCGDGDVVDSGYVTVDALADLLLSVKQIDGALLAEDRQYRVLLIARDAAGRVVAKNNYDNLLYHPPRPKGHPRRMNHDLGVRLFHA